MAGVTHTKVSAKSDGADTSLILPSDWNAQHTVDWGEDADITTSAVGDAAAAGATGEVADAGHRHGREAFGTTTAAVGTAAGGSATTPSKSDHVHATGAGTPSTQAFADAAAIGSGPAASMTDHKHAMPTLGYGLSGVSSPAVGLTTVSAYATATTSISGSAYADVTGVSVSLAAGTWLIVAVANASVVTTTAGIMHIAITDGSNALISEGSQSLGIGTASVAQNGNCVVVGIVSPGGTTTYKMRAARGNTTYTSTIVIMDGAGVATTNNLTNNSDKGTGIFAVRIA
jgi:hypothetical protein